MDHDYTTHHDYNPYLEGVPRGRRGSDANEGGSDDDSLRSVSSASTVDSSVTVSTDSMLDDTSPSEFVDMYFLGWPPSRADVEPDEDTSWWRPTMLRKGYWLRHICQQYHFAAVAIDSILQAKPWIDSLATADIPPAVSLYRHEFAAIDARLGEVNVMECYCPPICFTTVRDRLAWSRIPARLRPRRFNAPHAQVHSLDACCGLLRDPIDTSYVLQPWESDDDDDSDDEEVAYLFAEELCPGIRCLAPRGRAASDAAAPQSGWR